MTVETSIFRPDPERPGYLQLVRDRTVGEVLDDLRTALGEYPDGGEEYFSASALGADRPWPNGRIVVFSVNGSSEGDYTHLEVHLPDGSRDLIALAKTFMGRDASWAFARRLADLLEA